MSFRVRLTETAEADFEERVALLANRSPVAARRLVDRFNEALQRLHDFPFGCGLAHENSEFPNEIRHLLFGIHRKHRYRALFII